MRHSALNLIAPRPTTPTPAPEGDRVVWRVRCHTCDFYEGGIGRGDHAQAFAEHHRDDTGHAVDIRLLAEIHIDTVRSELDRR